MPLVLDLFSMKEYYSYSNKIWNYILPDRNKFCHWGGKAISYKMIEFLDLKNSDKICDICCGEAGTLTLINQPRIKVYGVDISDSALKKAREGLKELGNFNLVQADVKNMPFSNNFFDKILAQDPDVFLYPQKNEIMKEISRVSKIGAIFVCQTYCATFYLTPGEEKRTSLLLKEMGYRYTGVLKKEEIFKMFTLAGFKIQFIEEIHDVYAQDNLLMIKNLEKNWKKITGINKQERNKLKVLLEWEKYLFSKKAWTGVIIKAKKM